MSNLLSLLPASGWQRLLCDFVWQSTLIAILALLLLRFFVRQPSARAGLCLLALFACVVVPIASLAARNSGWTLWRTQVVAIEQTAIAANPTDSSLTDQSDDAAFDRPATGLNPSSHESSTPPEAITSAKITAQPQSQTGSQPQSDDVSNEIETTPRANPAVRATTSVPITTENRFAAQKPDWQSRLLPGIGLVWLVTTAALFFRLILSFIATYRLIRAAAPCEKPVLLAAADDAARRMGLKQSPRLLVSPKVATPMVCAFGTPCLLVPPAAADESAAERKHDWVAAFTHELAHVSRHDGWSRLAVEIVVAAVPLQPLVWWLRAFFHTACEEACDDRAVSRGINPLDLADALANWTTTRRSAAMLATIGMSSSKLRILRLVEMRTTPRGRTNRLSILASVGALVLAGAALCVAQTKSVPDVEKQSVPSAKNTPSEHEPSASGEAELFAKDPILRHYQQRLRELNESAKAEIAIDKSADYAELLKVLNKEIDELNKLVEDRQGELRRKQYQAGTSKKADNNAAAKSATPKAEPALDSVFEKAFKDDALIELYTSQYASTETDLSILKDKSQLTKEDEDSAKWYSARLAELAERIKQRKAEIRPRIAEELSAAAANKKTDASDKPQSVGTTKQYVIEPPDIVTIDMIQLSPKKPPRIMPMDKVRINVDGTMPDKPIAGIYPVDSNGEVVLGPVYGAVKISGLTRREAETAVHAKLEDTLANPEVALVLDESRYEKAIGGQHLVGPDGNINLGKYGQVRIAEMTIPQAIRAIEEHLSAEFADPQISLDIFAHNSKVYYVIVSGGQAGDNIYRFPITGNETVLDAIAGVPKLSGVSKANIFIARPQQGNTDKTIEVSWTDLISGKVKQNLQIQAGDRIFISGATYDHSGDAPKWDRSDSNNPTPSKYSY